MVVVIGAGGLCCLGFVSWTLEVRGPESGFTAVGVGSAVLQEIYY